MSPRWSGALCLLLGGVIVFGSACRTDAGEGSRSITVFAASSLTDAFTEIGTEFRDDNPDAQVEFNFAASSALAAQLLEGAPADVFASADESNMAKLVDAAEVRGEPAPIATNQLEIAVEPGNPKGVENLADLADPDLVVVLCAEQAPCGRLAKEVLDRAGVSVTPRSFEENVRAVVSKVQLGEADAGIVYVSDVRAANGAVQGMAIADDQNVVAEVPIAVTAASDEPDVAAAFVAFVSSERGQAILSSYGFGAP